MKKLQIILFGTIIVTFFCLSANYANADIIIVPKDQPSIQDAVNAANDGDIILVKAGTYNESVSVIGFTSLVIKAEGAGGSKKHVVVNPNPTGSAYGFYVISDGVTIEGFEICNTNFGVWFEGSHNRFSKNYIHDMYSTNYWWDGGVGICLWDMNGGSNYNEITQNIIEDVERTGILFDIAWTDGGTGINTGGNIISNLIKNTPWGAIEVLGAEEMTINHNKITDCGSWGIALLSAVIGMVTQKNTIAHNNINGQGYWAGIILYGFYGGVVKENVIHHNKVINVTTPYANWADPSNKDYRNSWN